MGWWGSGTAVRYPLSAIRGGGRPLKIIGRHYDKTMQPHFARGNAFPPLSAGGTTFTQEGGTTKLCEDVISYVALSKAGVVLPPLAGEVPRSGQGGGERSAPFPPTGTYRQMRHCRHAPGFFPVFRMTM